MEWRNSSISKWQNHPYTFESRVSRPLCFCCLPVLEIAQRGGEVAMTMRMMRMMRSSRAVGVAAAAAVAAAGRGTRGAVAQRGCSAGGAFGVVQRSTPGTNVTAWANSTSMRRRGDCGSWLHPRLAFHRCFSSISSSPASTYSLSCAGCGVQIQTKHIDKEGM